MSRGLSSGTPSKYTLGPAQVDWTGYFSVELWRCVGGIMHHSPFRRRWTGGTATVKGMEERIRLNSSTNLWSWFVATLVGGISATVARLMLTTCATIFIYLFFLVCLISGDPIVTRSMQTIVCYYCLLDQWWPYSHPVDANYCLFIVVCWISGGPIVTRSMQTIHCLNYCVQFASVSCWYDNMVFALD